MQLKGQRNGWGASAVDAFSTALVMQIPEIVDEILDYIPTINFANTTTDVSLFETTIRYLAGMLSGYDLLKGPLSNLNSNATNVDALLTQSTNLANVLKFAFNTPTGIPYNGLNVTNQTTIGDATNGLAGMGTLVLEWTHLSDLTGDSQYASLSQKAESYLLNPRPASSEPFPGLVGSNIDIDTGIWVLAADSSIANLTSHPSSRPDLTFLADYNGTNLIYASQHLACFDGGNFLLGGQVLGRQDYIDFGLALVNGCHDTYASTATHIGPESFAWDDSAVPSEQTAFYNASGFCLTNPAYILRPEVIESYYYAYRITGNATYQDWAWDAFVAINATTRTESGFSSISNVNAADGGTKTDLQESFLFAEVLKYSYLIHAPVEHDGVNSWVFNTEAHPFKVAGMPIRASGAGRGPSEG
ncbi:MAG: hypothetical protein Q9187_006083, partial [Circinaria calcarea]